MTFASKLQLIEQELIKRKTTKSFGKSHSFWTTKLLSTAIPKQIEFFNDISRRKVLFVPRRGGKSFIIGITLLAAALNNPNMKFFYIALTQDSAQNILWDKIIMKLINDNKIPCFPKASKKRIVFPNGSIIQLFGGNHSPNDVRKLLGGAYCGVVIDECGAYDQDLKAMIELLDPALTDYKKEGKFSGFLILAGTPSDKMSEGHYFYRITRDEDRLQEGWNIHTWNIWDNPYLTEGYKVTCQEHRDRYGDGYAERDDFAREWLCQWRIPNLSRVYSWTPANNFPKWMQKNEFQQTAEGFQALIVEDHKDERAIKRSIDNRDKKWYFVFGIDLGYKPDPSAIVVGCYCMTQKIFYVVESHLYPEYTYTQLANEIKALQAKYNPVKMVCDTGGGGRQGVEEMRRVHGLPLEAATKTGLKYLGIGRMNSDFETTNIRVICDGGDKGHTRNVELIKEWQGLVWDAKHWKRTGERRELASCPNHLADACLYAYRASYHYAADVMEEEQEQNPIMREKNQQMQDLVFYMEKNRQEIDPIDYQFHKADYPGEDKLSAYEEMAQEMDNLLFNRGKRYGD